MIRRISALIALLVVLAACTQPTPQLAVTTISPINGATSVPIDAEVTAVFNLAVRAQSVVDAFSLSVEGGAEVPGDVQYNPTGRLATFVPDDVLAYDTTYVATITTDLQTTAGANLRTARTWTFTTAEQTIPSVEGVAITGGDRGLTVGSTVQLAATVDYGTGLEGTGEVTWASGDSAVATVTESGLVEAVSVGTTVVTATSVEDDAHSDSVTITVAAAPGIYGLTINEGDQTIQVGDTAQFTVTVNAVSTDASVTWSVEPEATVILVDETGFVTAVGSGTASLTATSVADASWFDTVQVNVPVQSVTSVTIDPVDSALLVGETLALSATVVTEGGAPQAVDWSSADDAIATVDEDGVVTAVSFGTVDITATAAFDGVTSDSVTLDISEVVGVTIAGPADLYLAVSDVLTLVGNAVVNGSGSTDVDWASSEPETVAVDGDGEITIVSAAADPTQPVTITATSVLDPSQSASVNVYALAELLTVTGDYADYSGEANVNTLIDIAAPAVSGNVGAVTFTLLSGALPAEFVTLDEFGDPATEYAVVLDETTGQISGSTGYPGVYTGTIEIEDSLGQTASTTFELDLSLAFWFTGADLVTVETEFEYPLLPVIPEVVIPGDQVRVSGVQDTAFLPVDFHNALVFSLDPVAAYDSAGDPVVTTDDPFDINTLDGTVFLALDPAASAPVVGWVYDVTLEYTTGPVVATVQVAFYEEGSLPPTIP